MGINKPGPKSLEKESPFRGTLERGGNSTDNYIRIRLCVKRFVAQRTACFLGHPSDVVDLAMGPFPEAGNAIYGHRAVSKRGCPRDIPFLLSYPRVFDGNTAFHELLEEPSREIVGFYVGWHGSSVKSSAL